MSKRASAFAVRSASKKVKQISSASALAEIVLQP